jgi:ribosomal protein L25 (general stress protein Ctc)
MLQWQQQPLHDDNTVAIVVCVGCGSHPVLLSEVDAHSIKREIKHVPFPCLVFSTFLGKMLNFYVC